MLRCEINYKLQYHCIQWTGNNFNELKEVFGGIMSSSPFGDHQVALKGGDSYIVVNLNEWILWNDDDDNFNIVTDIDFKSNYEIITGE